MSGQINSDGSNSLPTDIATAYQSTTEALRTYHAVGQLPAAGIAESLIFVNNETLHNTEYLARKIMVNATAGNSVTALVEELLTHQNQEGGFGDLPGYASTPPDTAWTLEALALAGQVSSTAASYGVSYLVSQQTVDGRWSSGNPAAIYTSALVVQALTPYKVIYASVPNVIAAGIGYLMGARDNSTQWGEPFLTAQALLAIAPNLTDLSPLQTTINNFTAIQRAEGSWSGDVFQTALALRALKTIETATADPTLGRLRGVVIDAQTQLPLANVGVTLTGSIAAAAVTNGIGRGNRTGTPVKSRKATITDL